MSNLSDKEGTLYSSQTLTTTLAATGAVGAGFIDCTGYDEITFYPIYNPATSGDVFQSKVQFSNDGTNWHAEPAETVASGVATVVEKRRDFTSTSGDAYPVPPISIPLNDKNVRLLIADDAGVSGTATVTYRLKRLGG